MKRLTIVLLIIVSGAVLPLASQEQNVAKEVRRPMFLPKPLDDDWTRWIVGEWEGSGESDAGKGTFRLKVELGLNGQFLLYHGEASIAKLSDENKQYIKKNMHASDEEIERFQSLPYKGLEIHTIDQKTGEIVGYLFDSLRCIATGRGKRQANKEIMEWEWSTGHKSTRITEKISDDIIVVIERTPMPDGSIMEDRGQITRCKKATCSQGEQK